MKLFKINKIWQIGIRNYFDNRFVIMPNFEEMAAEFFSLIGSDPLLLVSHHAFCKKINSVYKQNIDALHSLRDRIQDCEDFDDVKIEKKHSAIGLPIILSYRHKRTDIKTEFDGVIFVSEKKISDEIMSIGKASQLVEKRGFIIEDGAQIGGSEDGIWQDLWEHTAARYSWYYATESADLKQYEQTLNTNNLILSMNFNDPRFVRMVQPTKQVRKGKRYSFLIGNKEHIRQVLCHESESSRYLLYLKDRLVRMKSEAMKRRNSLFLNAPLAPKSIREFVNPIRWRRLVNHWTSIHRGLEDIIRLKTHLDNYQMVFQSYKDFEKNAIAFYNLPNPIVGRNGEEYISQYQTRLPFLIKIKGDSVEIVDFDRTVNLYSGLPDKFLKFHAGTGKLIEDIFDIMRNITTTAGLQVAMVALLISVSAILISLIGLVFSICK